MRDCVIPRHQPWGSSVSVNHLLRSENTLTIEMQSGDTLTLEAKQIDFVEL